MFRNPVQLPACGIDLAPGLFSLLVIHAGGLLTHAPVYPLEDGEDDLQITAQLYCRRLGCTGNALCLQKQPRLGKNPLANLRRSVAPGRI